jgi:hypothetical protein
MTYRKDIPVKKLLTTAAILAVLTVSPTANAGMNIDRFNRDDVRSMRHGRDWVHNEPMLGVNAPEYPPRQSRPDLRALRDGSPTKAIMLYPGMAANVTVSKAFASAFVGDPGLIDTLPNTDSGLIVQAKAEGVTNIILVDADGRTVDTVKVTVLQRGHWSDERPDVIRIYNVGVGVVDYDCTYACHPIGSPKTKPTPTPTRTAKDVDDETTGRQQ